MDGLKLMVLQVLNSSVQEILDGFEIAAKQSPRGVGGAFCLISLEKAVWQIEAEIAAGLDADGELAILVRDIKAKAEEIKAVGPGDM